MAEPLNVCVLASPAEVAAAAAEEILRRSAETAGAFRIALSGGTSPVLLYDLLASPAWRGRIDWPRFHVFFADERAVPPDHPDSNYRLVREHLLAGVPVAAARVHRMRADGPLERGAAEYESLVTEPLDLIVLGLGPDGHIASLFPARAAVRERDHRVLAVFDSPKPPERRLTLAPPALAEARHIVVLATGAAKASAVGRALEKDTDPAEVPARLVRDRVWLVDRAAAPETGGS